MMWGFQCPWWFGWLMWLDGLFHPRLPPPSPEEEAVREWMRDGSGHVAEVRHRWLQELTTQHARERTVETLVVVNKLPVRRPPTSAGLLERVVVRFAEQGRGLRR